MKLQDFCKKSITDETISESAASDKKLLSQLYKGVYSDKPEIKFKSAKALRKLSEDKPELIYPNWDFFVGLLDSENTFIKTIAIGIIANLTVIDSKNKFDKIFTKYYKLIDDKSMIPTATLVGNSGLIAKAKPNFQSKITNKLIKIDRTRHSSECKNIIKGKAILAFNEYFEESNDKKMILNFVSCELKNTRSATRKKAERFLKKWNKVPNLKY